MMVLDPGLLRQLLCTDCFHHLLCRQQKTKWVRIEEFLVPVELPVEFVFRLSSAFF